MGLDFSDKIAEVSKSIKYPEQMLGTGLLQPFNGCNAGARKIMYSTHRSHVFPLIRGEKAIIETGYEIKYGDYSSSITRTDSDYKVIAKISKFSFSPQHHYWLILEDLNNKRLDIIERISYYYTTESYGYLYNNEFIDNLTIGSVVPDKTILQKSVAFDEYNNRKDGNNLNIIYLALDDNMEDSIIFSDEAAGKLSSPLFKPVRVMINDNTIPLNIYGDNKNYKIIPDIGEDVKDTILIALRKEKKDEAYYTQSVDRLRQIMMSDEVKQIKGKVIDIDIYCNNPEILDSYYYGQLQMYHNELLRRSSEFVKILMPYKSNGYKFTYDLQKMYGISKRVINNDKYIEKRAFSNIILNITVMEELKLNAGDKVSNRYGGKGIVSQIWPKNYMPRIKTSTGEYIYADAIFNSPTMYGRENVGQVFELSLNHISAEIINKIKNDKVSLKEAYQMIHDFIALCFESQLEFLEETVSNMTEEELGFFIESIVNSGNIQLSGEPISETMTIDKLALIYERFPWIEQNNIEVSIIDSEGKVRYIPARRKMVMGKQYIFRLKQFSEEKFSATSLSATNIRNENIKSKAKKESRILYPNTPIRFGNMETNNFMHLGPDVVITNMMIHSVSPQGRRLVEQMYTTDNPFVIDIKLDSDSKNRSAEIVNTFLKTIGRRLKFVKKLKVIDKITYSPITFFKDPIEYPIRFIPKQDWDTIDIEKDFEERQKMYKDIEENNIESPILFEGSHSRRPKEI